MSSAYASSLAAATGGLSAQVAAAARSSLGAALRAGGRIGGPASEALVTAAKSSFTHAMDRGLVVGAAITLPGRLMSLIWLPARAQPVPAGDGTHEI